MCVSRFLLALHFSKLGNQHSMVAPELSCKMSLLLPSYLSAVGYPEAYFARARMSDDIILRAIHTIRGDDIYKLTAFLPLPEHRTTALATQV